VGNAMQSMPAGTLISGPEITPDELQLAARNHSMPLETQPSRRTGVKHLIALQDHDKSATTNHGTKTFIVHGNPPNSGIGLTPRARPESLSAP
jgi:hypothetical protein